MGARDRSAANVQRGRHEQVDAQGFGADRSADDIDDGIRGSDFVEVNWLNVDVVYLGFRRAERQKDFVRRRPRRLGDRSLCDNLAESRSGCVRAGDHGRHRSLVHRDVPNGPCWSACAMLFRAQVPVSRNRVLLLPELLARQIFFAVYDNVKLAGGDTSRGRTRESSSVAPMFRPATVFSNRSSGTPASSRAPRNMSPLIPEKQSR